MDVPAMRHHWPLMMGLLLLSVVRPASASSPVLDGIRPPGGQRGTEVDVTLVGDRLSDAQEILYNRPGIETVSIEPVDARNVKVRLRIATDCAVGLHDLRLRTATGISRLRTFSVGALPEIQEHEPNNDFDAPEAIPMNVVVNGVAENEDVDYFVVEAKKGDRITAEVEGIRLGITLFDPYVAILDEKRFELSASDDSALVWQDGFAQILAPEDGRYIIQVRESAYAGNGACLYRLHVGDLPRPLAVYPAGGPAGETVEVTWIGDIQGDSTEPVSLPAEPNEDHVLIRQDERGTAPYPYLFRVSPFGNVLEVEPNNDSSTATPFEPPLALNGVISAPGDSDHFVFHATKGQVFDVIAYARRLRSPLDPVMHIARKGGAYIAGADDSIGPDCTIRFTAPEDGEYVVYLHDHLMKGGPALVYRVEVTPVAPLLTVGLPTESPRPGALPIQAIEVPRGNRQAVLVTAARADFGGDLILSAEGLPSGMVLHAEKMPASQVQFPVVFEATEDAPVSGSLAMIRGTHADPNTRIPDRFRHSAEFVLGENNVPFWTRTVDRVAAVVTEEAPFSIDIVEPKVPLVRNGTMNLKVVASRKEGFTSPVSLRLPWLPPGVGASGSVVIPEGQNEALIPMNANGNAEIGAWKIVVDGRADTPTGPITVSSRLTKLEIAEPFVSLAYQPATVEQGKSVDFLVNVTKLHDFPGEAQVQLIGLPNQATTPIRTIDQNSTEIIFPISTTVQTPDGKHGNLFCQVIVLMNDEPIVHNLGSGELRVDKPLPAPAETTASPPTTSETPPKPAEKPLSPLEKLRMQAAERAKAQREAAAATP